MCRHGHLNTKEWYNEPLPDLVVTLWGIRPIWLPQVAEERAQLSFNPFPWESKLAFHFEASDSALYQLDPVLNLLVETNTIFHTFGPSAYIMEIPGAKPALKELGDTIRLAALAWATILLPQSLNAVTFNFLTMTPKWLWSLVSLNLPKNPYANTNLRKELQLVRFNNGQLFHTAVMTCKGPDTGMSRVIISYIITDPLMSKKCAFACQTISNLACFMHHWWIECGYVKAHANTSCAPFILKRQDWQNTRLGTLKQKWLHHILPQNPLPT